MLRAILNKSWRQHPTRHKLYGHLPPITKTIQVRRTRHAAHCWRSRDKLISDVLFWTPTHGRAKAGRRARTYIQQLCEDTGCCPESMNALYLCTLQWCYLVKLQFFYKDSFEIKYPTNVDMPLNGEAKPSQAINIILLLVWLHLNETVLELDHFC